MSSLANFPVFLRCVYILNLLDSSLSSNKMVCVILKFIMSNLNSFRLTLPKEIIYPSRNKTAYGKYGLLLNINNVLSRDRKRRYIH